MRTPNERTIPGTQISSNRAMHRPAHIRTYRPITDHSEVVDICRHVCKSLPVLTWMRLFALLSLTLCFFVRRTPVCFLIMQMEGMMPFRMKLTSKPEIQALEFSFVLMLRKTAFKPLWRAKSEVKCCGCGGLVRGRNVVDKD